MECTFSWLVPILTNSEEFSKEVYEGEQRRLRNVPDWKTWSPPSTDSILNAQWRLELGWYERTSGELSNAWTQGLRTHSPYILLKVSRATRLTPLDKEYSVHCKGIIIAKLRGRSDVITNQFCSGTSSVGDCEAGGQAVTVVSLPDVRVGGNIPHCTNTEYFKVICTVVVDRKSPLQALPSCFSSPSVQASYSSALAPEASVVSVFEGLRYHVKLRGTDSNGPDDHVLVFAPLLILNSPHFKGFLRPIQDINNPLEDAIHINCEKGIIELLKRILVEGDIKNFEKPQLIPLLRFAHHYDFKAINIKCGRLLIGEVIPENALYIYMAAIRYNNDGLRADVARQIHMSIGLSAAVKSTQAQELLKEYPETKRRLMEDAMNLDYHELTSETAHLRLLP